MEGHFGTEEGLSWLDIAFLLPWTLSNDPVRYEYATREGNISRYYELLVLAKRTNQLTAAATDIKRKLSFGRQRSATGLGRAYVFSWKRSQSVVVNGKPCKFGVQHEGSNNSFELLKYSCLVSFRTFQAIQTIP